MRANGSSSNYQSSARVHAIIMTRDRPETLKRCVDTALFSLGSADALTVLDDSGAMVSHTNATVLAEAAGRSMVQIAHLRTAALHDVIARAAGGHIALWQCRTAPRDIAPLRNLSLLLSATVDAQTTILIDDDICCFNLEATHHVCDSHYRATGAVIVGANIGGTTEHDIVTRLYGAIQALRSKAHYSEVPTEELFRVTPGADAPNVQAHGCLSAGYIAFCLPAASLFAFPPGYNEDWLWCLLHRASGHTCLLRADQAVVHNPPALRQLTDDDILFELMGDFIFDCLLEFRDGTASPESILGDLASCALDPSATPAARARDLLEQACGQWNNEQRRALARLESYGLSVLREMLHFGKLEIDGRREVREWSADAAAKHKSFRTTLGLMAVWCAMRAALREGRK